MKINKIWKMQLQNSQRISLTSKPLITRYKKLKNQVILQLKRDLSNPNLIMDPYLDISLF